MAITFKQLNFSKKQVTKKYDFCRKIVIFVYATCDQIFVLHSTF